MNYYQLVKLYFSIIDKNTPVKLKYLKCDNVFDKLYQQQNYINYCCCSFHQNYFNLKNIMRKKLSKTEHEKYIFKRACRFFYQVNKGMLYANGIDIPKNKKELIDWNFIMKKYKINRKGYILNTYKYY